MSQLLRFLIILCWITVLINNTNAQIRWQFIGMARDSTIFFVDRTVTKNSSGTVQAWEKIIYSNESYVIGLNEWKCSEKMKRVIQTITYYPNGDYQSRSLVPLPWRYVVPKSVEEQIYNLVCRNLRLGESRVGNIKGLYSNSATAQIINRKAYLMSEASSESKAVRKLTFGEKLILVNENPTSTGWYLIFDTKSEAQAWLHGNYFKIIKSKTSSSKKQITQN